MICGRSDAESDLTRIIWKRLSRSSSSTDRKTAQRLTNFFVLLGETTSGFPISVATE